MQQIKEGLEILLPYCNGVHGYGEFAAEHDVVYCDPTSKDIITEEDKRKLDKLGWFWDDKYECWSHYC